MRKRKTENIFTGTWQVVHVEIINCSEAWGQYGEFPDESMEWEFIVEREIHNSNGDVIYEGEFIEITKYLEYGPRKFQYDPAEQTLTIDFSNREQDGFMSECYEKMYKVKHLSGRLPFRGEGCEEGCEEPLTIELEHIADGMSGLPYIIRIVRIY